MLKSIASIVLAVAAAALPPAIAFAEPLEFRSDGFFSTPDGNAKLRWDNNTRCILLSIGDETAIQFAGPTNSSGNISPWRPAQPKVSNDSQARKITIANEGSTEASCQIEMSESAGGVRIDIESLPESSKIQVFRLLFPVKLFAGKEVLVDEKPITLPMDYNETSRIFAATSNAVFPPLSLRASPGLRIDIIPLSESAKTTLADCRQWKEEKFHLPITMKGGKTSLLVKLSDAKSAPN